MFPVLLFAGPIVFDSPYPFNLAANNRLVNLALTDFCN